MSIARSPSEARHDGDLAHDRRVGFQRRRRHSGRPQDLRRLGVYGASAITALTAQNTRGVTGIHDVPPDFIAAQIDAVFDDLDVGAVKIGMLSQPATIAAVADRLRRHKAKNIVLDPVMVATSGAKLISDHAIDALRRELIPMALVVTPDLAEAAVLSGAAIARMKTR